MFFDDYFKIASKILGLTLTTRNKERYRSSINEFPYRSSRAYIAKLVSSGYKVAICEQTEDPKLAKGIVKEKL